MYINTMMCNNYNEVHDCGLGSHNIINIHVSYALYIEYDMNVYMYHLLPHLSSHSQVRLH